MQAILPGDNLWLHFGQVWIDTTLGADSLNTTSNDRQNI